MFHTLQRFYFIFIVNTQNTRSVTQCLSIKRPMTNFSENLCTIAVQIELYVLYLFLYYIFLIISYNIIFSLFLYYSITIKIIAKQSHDNVMFNFRQWYFVSGNSSDNDFDIGKVYRQPITLISSHEVEVCKLYLKFFMGNNDINFTLPKCMPNQNFTNPRR